MCVRERETGRKTEIRVTSSLESVLDLYVKYENNIYNYGNNIYPAKKAK